MAEEGKGEGEKKAGEATPARFEHVTLCARIRHPFAWAWAKVRGKPPPKLEAKAIKGTDDTAPWYTYACYPALASISYLALIVLFSWWSSKITVTKLRGLEANALGDFLAGGFAPLAFMWLVWGYMLQSHELRMQRKEMKENRRALEEQGDQQEKFAAAMEIASFLNIVNSMKENCMTEAAFICDIANNYFISNEVMIRMEHKTSGDVIDLALAKMSLIIENDKHIRKTVTEDFRNQRESMLLHRIKMYHQKYCILIRFVQSINNSTINNILSTITKDSNYDYLYNLTSKYLADLPPGNT
ncbi:MAG: hypothetical protein IT557_18645 [Alphaproteobacteria bacterium]|nr:hypothetical protein [Alphaproteobacteria bacterium]